MIGLAGCCGSGSDDVEGLPSQWPGRAVDGSSSGKSVGGLRLVVRDDADGSGSTAVREVAGVTGVCDGRPVGPPVGGAAVDVLLDAYRREGIDGLGRLGGAWSAVLLDSREGRGRLVLARGDGGCPLFVTTAGPRVLFASAVADLLADAAVPRSVDERRFRDFLAGRPPTDPAATFFAGIQGVPAGHWLSIGALARDSSADGADRPVPAPIALPPRSGAEGHRLPGALPDAATLMAELPEAVRELGEPLAGLADYLRWRAARTDAAPGPAAEVGDPEALIGRWLRVRRAQVQGVFRSPAFCSRPYWNGLSVAEAFRRACGRPGRPMTPFWRALNGELWLRTFVDRPRKTLGQPLAVGESEELGDRGCRAGVPVAAACRPNEGRHLAMVARDRSAYLRLPVRTRNVWPGDRLPDVVTEGLHDCGVPLLEGDVLIVAEKIVAIGQGHVVPVEQVRVRPLARLLARYTFRTPSGIFLGLPESFELAIREAGLPRILAGATAAALTRPLGIRGVFYRIAGWQVAAIDSPDPDALPPSDTCIKLAPRDPQGVSVRLAEQLSRQAGARVEVAVIDANDLGAEVLGASSGVDRRLLVSLLRDNPLGQETQRTPVGIVRRAVAAR